MKILPIIALLASAMSCGRFPESNLSNSTPDSPQLTVTESSPTPTQAVANLVSRVSINPPRTISGGLLNDKAVSLPPPDYSAAMRKLKLKGVIGVQVLVDKKGDVVSATAVGGHPLLSSAAEQAARKATFEPLVLSGQKVTFSGIIRYEFKP